MTEILVLCTYWEPDYWDNDKVAPYPKRSIKPIQHLKNAVPLAGIGIYTRGKDRDFTAQPPCFLIVRDIKENEMGEPQFDFHHISKIEGVTSSTLLNEIGTRNLFFSISEEKVLQVLRRFGVKPPPEWQKLLELRAPPTPSWLDWVGKHFQDITQTISNDEYEDRIAELFTVLGFEVEQLGHRKEGEYPDGIAYSKDFAIIYDCKNRSGYFTNANDKRAMTKYVNYEKRRIQELRENIKEIHFAFIAHSYGNVESISGVEKETASKGFLLTSEALLYLLYKKTSLGRLFPLTDFEELISSQPITIDAVKRIYGR